MDAVVICDQDSSHKFIANCRLSIADFTTANQARVRKIGNWQSEIGNLSGEIRLRPVDLQEKLIARDAHAAFLLIAFASQR
jgi:hypothetical protein